MRLVKSPAVLMFFLFAVLLSAQLGSVTFANKPTLDPVDRALPDFSLRGVDGTVYEPKTLKGKAWLINFWAVWCAPCLDELPALNEAWAQLEKENVGMLAINIGEEAQAIDDFLKEHNLKIDFPIVIGDKIRSLGNWSGRGLPYTVVVSPDGRVVYEATGPREWNESQFVDAVIAVGNMRSENTIGARAAALLTGFHALNNVLKALIVLSLIAAAVGLMWFIRSLHRRKMAKGLN